MSRRIVLQIALTFGSLVVKFTHSTVDVRQEDGTVRKIHDWSLSVWSSVNRKFSSDELRSDR